MNDKLKSEEKTSTDTYIGTKAPIGIFDSGYGGLTILSEIKKLLPEYDFIYLGDNARTPYGTRSFDIVYKYTLECVTKLFDMGCQLVILACNTASAKALRTIQQNDLPRIDPNKRVLGVIRPTVENISHFTKSRHIGLLGTPGTVQSNSYLLEIAKLHSDIILSSEPCPMWVPLIENNEHESEGADFFVKKHLQNILRTDPEIDTLILGCTHYPLLMDKIKKFLPANIKVIAQGDLVAKSLVDYLERHPEMDSKCSKNGKTQYFSTESPEKFITSASVFLKEKISAEHINIG